VMHNTAKEENIQEGTVGRNNLKYSVLGWHRYYPCKLLAYEDNTELWSLYWNTKRYESLPLSSLSTKKNVWSVAPPRQQQDTYRSAHYSDYYKCSDWECCSTHTNSHKFTPSDSWLFERQPVRIPLYTDKEAVWNALCQQLQIKDICISSQVEKRTCQSLVSVYRRTQHINLLSKTHYTGDMFWLPSSHHSVIYSVLQRSTKVDIELVITKYKKYITEWF
jgi:hypothetical protein